MADDPFANLISVEEEEEDELDPFSALVPQQDDPFAALAPEVDDPFAGLVPAEEPSPAVEDEDLEEPEERPPEMRQLFRVVDDDNTSFATDAELFQLAAEGSPEVQRRANTEIENRVQGAQRVPLLQELTNPETIGDEGEGAQELPDTASGLAQINAVKAQRRGFLAGRVGPVEVDISDRENIPSDLFSLVPEPGGGPGTLVPFKLPPKSRAEELAERGLIGPGLAHRMLAELRETVESGDLTRVGPLQRAALEETEKGVVETTSKILEPAEEIFLAVRGERVGFDTAATKELERIGIFPRKGETLLAEPIKHINKALINLAVGSLEAVVGGTVAVFEGGVEAVDQIRIANGGEPRDGRLKRDLNIIIEVGIIISALGPLRFAKAPRISAVQRAEATRALKKARKDLNKTDARLDDAEVMIKAAQEQVDKIVSQAVGLPKGSNVIIKKSIEEEFLNASIAVAEAETKLNFLTRGIPQILNDGKATFTQERFVDFVDQVAGLRFLAERGAAKLGTTPDLSAYREARLLAGSRGVMDAVIDFGTIRFNDLGEAVFNGIGLREVFKPVAASRREMAEFVEFMVGKRAGDLVARGIKVPLSEEEIARRVALGKGRTNFEEARVNLRDFNRRMLDLAEDSGILDAKTKAKFVEMGENFVPFYRAATDVTREGEFLKTGRNPFKAIKGEEEIPLGDILDNITRNAMAIVDMSLKNRARQAAFKMVEDLGLTEIATKIPAGKIRAAALDKNIEKVLVRLGMKKPGEAVKVFAYEHPIGENIEVVFNNGKRTFYQIEDPLFGKALRAFRPRSVGLAMRIAGGATNLLRRGVTGSPIFIIKNLIRDTQVAFIQSQAGFVPVLDTLIGLKSRVMKDRTYQQALVNGAGFSTTFRAESGVLRDRIDRFYTAKGIRPETVLDTPAKLARGIESFSTAFEEASRLREFQKLRNKGANLRDAALGFRNVTADFGVRGSSEFIQNAAMMLPFMNARLQGVKTIVQTARGDPAKVAMKGVSVITVPTLALLAINSQDPAYQELPAFQREQFWPIPTPEGTTDANGNPIKFWLLSKGFEAGAIFGTIPELIVQAIDEDYGPRTRDAMLRVILDTFALDPIPQIVRPGVMAGNPFGEFEGFNTRFTGTPVTPEELKKLRLSQQNRPWTSTTMVVLARVMSQELGIEMSPIKAEAIFKGYLGMLGAHALAASDIMVEIAQGEERSFNRLDETALGAFITVEPQRRTEFTTSFYDALSESRMIAATMNKMLDEVQIRSKEDFEASFSDFDVKLGTGGLAKTLGRIDNQLALLRRKRDRDARLEKDPAKRDKIIRETQEAINQITYEFARTAPESIEDILRKFKFPPTPGPRERLKAK